MSSLFLFQLYSNFTSLFIYLRIMELLLFLELQVKEFTVDTGFLLNGVVFDSNLFWVDI